MKKKTLYASFAVLIMTSGISRGATSLPLKEDIANVRKSSNSMQEVGRQLRDAVISTSLFSQIHENLIFGFSYARVDGTASAPLGVFDMLEGDDINNNLAQLVSFYLGEASNEDYECIVQRKGTSIIQALKNESTKPAIFCLEFVEVLETSERKLVIKNLIPKNFCYSRDETVKRANYLINLIKSNKYCSIEK